MVGMVWGSATGSEPLATGDEFYEKRTGACGSSNFVSIQQPLEHFVLGDALLDLAQTACLLERRVHLSRVGAALAGDLAQAVRVAMAGGGNVLSSRVITSLFEEDAHEPERGSEGESEKAPVSSPQVNLTAREIDILSLVAEGQSNRDVAAHLFLSEKTVKAHLASIFRKMGVTNRTQAAMAALDMGIGPSHENAPAHLQPRQPQA
jgi:DNA-binding CsgD family transcriptional regulator